MVREKQRLSQSQKNAKDKAWFKENIDRLDRVDVDTYYPDGNVISDKRRMKVNYDLFNNIINLKDFEYVCKPYGSESGELPADMVNRDISSGKIKAIMGMEMKRPFSYKVIATNPEATTIREQEEFGQIKKYVIDQIMLPIRQQTELEFKKRTEGKDLSEKQKQELMQELEQQAQKNTPDRIRKYMERDFQTPVEVMSQQLLDYLVQKCSIKRRFNRALKHELLSGKGSLFVGIFNGEPDAWNVNSLHLTHDRTGSSPFIEDGDWANCRYFMTRSAIQANFGDELSDADTDLIYEGLQMGYNEYQEDLFREVDVYGDTNGGDSIEVVHAVWKALRKVGFLSYYDEKGEVQKTLVDETYGSLNTDFGDIEIEWQWIPEVYEGWKIKTSTPIYVNMRPIPGQFKDLDNVYYCKLPYIGVICDNMNSQETSIMDRLKPYQYYYNIVMYRLELLLASDNGKKLMMNINAVPDSAGIDMKKWHYFFKANDIMWVDPNEEGVDYGDVNTLGKVMDLSLVSDIQKYMEIAEYLRVQAGRSIGVTEQVEGQIGAREAVRNTQQALVQTSHILEPIFDLHSHLKRNVLQALLECAKVAYSGSDKKKLAYTLDDMSTKILNLDIGLLDNCTLGVFIADSAEASEARQTIEQLSHAAMQNQTIELSDVISILKQNGIAEAEEALKVAEQKRRDHELEMQGQTVKMQQEEAERERQRRKEEHTEKLEEIEFEYEKRKELEIVKGALIGASYNPDVDKDRDGVNDYLEIARHGLDAEIKKGKLELEREKFEHKKKEDKKKDS